MKEIWMMIANPNAATQDTGATWETYKKQLTDGGAQVEASLTAHKGHAIDLAREAAEKGYRKLIAVGGDGTVHEVMTGLLRYADATPGADLGDFTLAVIPAGTGNDWIKTAGIPEDVTEATACILRGHTGKEDIVRLTLDSGVFCLANIGVKPFTAGNSSRRSSATASTAAAASSRTRRAEAGRTEWWKCPSSPAATTSRACPR